VEGKRKVRGTKDNKSDGWEEGIKERRVVVILRRVGQESEMRELDGMRGLKGMR
jgi:hypothetical protein